MLNEAKPSRWKPEGRNRDQCYEDKATIVASGTGLVALTFVVILHCRHYR